MPHATIERLREGVRRVGEAEPLIGLGLAMGRAGDYLIDTYESAKRTMKRYPSKERKPTRRIAPVQRALLRKGR